MKVGTWLAVACVPVASFGVGVAAVATWLTWRVRFHSAAASNVEASRVWEAWAGRGATIALAAGLVFFACVGARLVRSRWFRWLGWLPAAAFLALTVLLGMPLFAVGVAESLEKCARHPELRGCELSDKPPGADPAVEKTEPEWQLAAVGVGLVTAMLGLGASGVLVTGFWIAAVGRGVIGFVRGASPPSRRSPRPPAGP